MSGTPISLRGKSRTDLCGNSVNLPRTEANNDRWRPLGNGGAENDELMFANWAVQRAKTRHARAENPPSQARTRLSFADGIYVVCRGRLKNHQIAETRKVRVPARPAGNCLEEARSLGQETGRHGKRSGAGYGNGNRRHG